uniref:NADH-ubiquinone oxidoreductase chain 6 n=1 Tax=Tylototriton kweichowensis TaxID=385676 RepID=A0A0U3ANS4_9SALA|nr:NADH dehydrogenase subunit 6 [Tylototriton kweichowensis]ALS92814.1 NADH dehydrogenase subunit 6 [Tylototriton kweichowensis]WAK99376.1 NADH dehydrogenase subunit 6 [Tylototriton kweichowensis]
MIYLSFLFMIGVLVGLVAVASNPSPYFAAFGLVLASVSGCCLLVDFGVSFLSLVLLLIYLGGMMVVFAYSASLAAEPYPEAWGSWSVVVYVCVYVIFLVVGVVLFDCKYSIVHLFSGYCVDFRVVGLDWGGVGVMYSVGGLLLVLVGWALLLTLFVVLEVTRGVSRGALRAV